MNEYKVNSKFWISIRKFFFKQHSHCVIRKFSKKKTRIWHWWYKNLVYDIQSELTLYLWGFHKFIFSALLQIFIYQTKYLPIRFYNEYLGYRGKWRSGIRWSIIKWKARKKNRTYEEELNEVKNIIIKNYSVNEDHAKQIAEKALSEVGTGRFRVEAIKFFIAQYQFRFWHDHVK